MTNFYYSSWNKNVKNPKFFEQAKLSLRKAEECKKLKNFLFINFVTSDQPGTNVNLDVMIEKLLPELSKKSIMEKKTKSLKSSAKFGKNGSEKKV